MIQLLTTNMVIFKSSTLCYIIILGPAAALEPLFVVSVPVEFVLSPSLIVIGKKVNMAARLMMHYPGKVSCDPETFHHSKLPRHYFHELPQKEMKGVRNPGIIHEFIERDE